MKETSRMGTGIFAEIVNDYICRFKKKAEEELEYFKSQRSLKEAVSKAALARKPSGRKFSHQKRIPKSVLEKAQKILLSNIDEIATAKSFDHLHDMIEKLVRSIRGIGELYIYDTALRIGAKLGFEPDKIYLHRGTREGAKHLGLNFNKKYLEITEVPAELRTLKPREIEDLLCIYKNQFKKSADKADASELAMGRQTCR